MSRYILGIDPGIGGGIAVLEEDGTLRSAQPMPVIGSGRSRDQYDTTALREDLVGAVHVFFERLQPMPGRFGASANFGLGRACALIEGICVGAQVPYTMVHPNTWQKVMLEGTPGEDTKQRAIMVAKRLFPGVCLRRTERAKKDDDGIADALLIAEYGRRLLKP
jgi:hypothetical protein